MIKFITVVLALSPMWVIANDTFENGTFKINQANCNLPMDKIRQLIPDQDDQQEALKRCMEKATEERWTRNKNLTTK